MPTMLDTTISSLASHTQKDIAAAIGAEHGYHVNNIAHGVALGILRRARYALVGENVKSCGDVMFLLANGPNPVRGTDEWFEEQKRRDDHPYHDGELDCKIVRGALVSLNLYWNKEWRNPDSWVWRNV